MSVPITAEDRELVEMLRTQVREEFDSRVGPLQKQMATLMQRSSRPPGAVLEQIALTEPSLGAQLAVDVGFQSFTRSVLTSHSHYATELRLPPSRKGTPVTGVTPTEYLPQRIWGQPAFPLRLHDLMPVLSVGLEVWQRRIHEGKQLRAERPGGAGKRAEADHGDHLDRGDCQGRDHRQHREGE